MKITIPLVQKVSINSMYPMHWKKRDKINQLFHQSLIEHRNKVVTEFPVDISLIFSFKGRTLDCDNCFSMAKMLIDGLRHWHIIPDDTPDYIQSVTCMSKKSAIKKDEVEIIIV